MATTQKTFDTPADKEAQGNVGPQILNELQNALDNLGTNVFMADADRKLVFANKKAQETLQTVAGEIKRIFGVDVNDLIGASIHKIGRASCRERV